MDARIALAIGGIALAREIVALIRDLREPKD